MLYFFVILYVEYEYNGQCVTHLNRIKRKQPILALSYLRFFLLCFIIVLVENNSLA